jgi:hypothetical protein
VLKSEGYAAVKRTVGCSFSLKYLTQKRENIMFDLRSMLHVDTKMDQIVREWS